MDHLITTPHHQFFSVEKANRALVLVRPIVTELLAKHKRLQKVQFEIEGLEAKLSSQIEESPIEENLLDQLYAEMQSLLDYIAHNIEELHLIGCVFKDFMVGIVDFPTHFNGRDVYLCWQHGEIDITHWHEMEEGFSGRNPINEYFIKHSGAEAAVSTLTP